MEVTRRFWLFSLLGLCLGVTGVVLTEPLLIVGAIGLGAWLLATQLAFIRCVTKLREQLSVEQTLSRTTVRSESEASYLLSASLPEPLPVSVTVSAIIPLGVDVSESGPELTLEPKETKASTTSSLVWQTVGQHEFSPPAIQVEDPSGLFIQEFSAGSPVEVVVEPNEPGPIHVGQGGDRLSMGFGEHRARGREGGLVPEEIRKYIAGDAANQIDWKATARLNEPHVRTYEGETNHRLLLMVDHRSSMADGVAGETKLDYTKSIASAFRATASSATDPLGFVSVNDSGVTKQIDPVASPRTYELVYHQLTDLEPSTTRTQEDILDQRGETIAQAAADWDNVSETAFKSILSSYRSARPAKSATKQQLYTGLRAVLDEATESGTVVILTDDTHPHELKSTVATARHVGLDIIIFITPTVLFEPDGLSDLETAYNRYREFEEFRQDLTMIPNVTAYEVAPPDRLSAVLSENRTKQMSGGNV